MTRRPLRSWRFVHPDFDAPEAIAGLQVSPHGRIAMADGSEAVRQRLLLLLSTIPGERVMRPDYGCDLHRLVFARNDPATAGLAIHYVRQAVERWEPRVDLLDVDAGADPAWPERLNVVLAYRIRATRREDRIAFSLDLMGEPL